MKIKVILLLLLFCSCESSDKKNILDMDKRIHERITAKVWKGYCFQKKPPEMYMSFKKNGQLIFRGGFEYYNPAKWHYNIQKKLLYIHVASFFKENIKVLQYWKENDDSFDFNLKKNQMIYKFTYRTKSINFLNFGYSQD